MVQAGVGVGLAVKGPGGKNGSTSGEKSLQRALNYKGVDREYLLKNPVRVRD